MPREAEEQEREDDDQQEHETESDPTRTDLVGVHLDCGGNDEIGEHPTSLAKTGEEVGLRQGRLHERLHQLEVLGRPGLGLNFTRDGKP